MDIKLIASGSRPWEHWLGYWGLSYLIDGTILYDTFIDYSVLARKLRRSGVDPSAIQSVVISHDHRDHTGGVCAFLETRPGIDVHLPPSANESVKHRIVLSGGRLVDVPGVKALKENVWLSDELIGYYKGQPIAEHSILLKTQKGFILLVGCSHPGILSIVKKAKEMFGTPIYGVMGGLHLRNTDTEAIHNCAHALKDEGVQMIAPTHCTGWRAERVFKNVFKNGFVHLHEGHTLSL